MGLIVLLLLACALCLLLAVLYPFFACSRFLGIPLIGAREAWIMRGTSVFSMLVVLIWYADISLVWRWANIAVLGGLGLALVLLGRFFRRQRFVVVGRVLSGMALFGLFLLTFYVVLWLGFNLAPYTRVGPHEYCGIVSFTGARDTTFNVEVFHRSGAFDHKVAEEQLLFNDYFDPQPDTPEARVLLDRCQAAFPAGVSER